MRTRMTFPEPAESGQDLQPATILRIGPKPTDIVSPDTVLATLINLDNGIFDIQAGMTGRVVEICTQEGQSLSPGDTILLLESPDLQE